MGIDTRISEWIDAHADELVRDIGRLVAVPSVRGEPEPDAPFGPGPRRALDEMVSLCAGYGFATGTYHGAMGRADYNGTPAAMDILGHLDIVAPG